MDDARRIKIDRVVIENYRSIKHCDAHLNDRVTFLVGKNGAGKSSFFDALRFLQSVLGKGLKAAVDERNGLSTVLYRPTIFPTEIKFELFVSGAHLQNGRFAVRFRATSWTDLSLAFESCSVTHQNMSSTEYTVDKEGVSGSVENLPPAVPERLYLASVAGLPDYRIVYELLTNLLFSEYSPKGLHLLLFNRFSSSYGLASRTRDLVSNAPERRRVIEEYLRLMIPNFLRLEIESSGGRDWIAFIEQQNGQEERFYLPQVSDGTVYATELLIDLFANGLKGDVYAPILLEEPGANLHPWASGVLRNAIAEAASQRQVIVTTHSADLLDDPGVDPASVRLVYRNLGGTHVVPLEGGALSVLESGLATAGELFRTGGLVSDIETSAVVYNEHA